MKPRQTTLFIVSVSLLFIVCIPNNLEGVSFNAPILLEYAFSFGEPGTGSGQFENPMHIFANETHVFVSDRNQWRVQIFSMYGDYEGSIGSYGEEPYQFEQVEGIFVNDSCIFIADIINQTVQIYDLAGNYITRFGQGHLNEPYDVVHNGSHIFVSNGGWGDIRVFDSSGSYLYNIPTMPVAGSIAMSENNHLYVVDLQNDVVDIIGPTYSGWVEGDYGNIIGIDVVDQFVVVTETTNHNLQFSYINGSYLFSLGAYGDGAFDFEYPVGVTHNSNYVYVLDWDRKDITAYKFRGTTITETITDTQTSIITDTLTTIGTSTETEIITETVTETGSSEPITTTIPETVETTKEITASTVYTSTTLVTEQKSEVTFGWIGLLVALVTLSIFYPKKRA